MRLHKNGNDFKFFVNCEVLVEQPVYFRNLEDECPYPMIHPPTPPAEEVCYLFAKRAAENVERTVEILGENANSVAECYIKVVDTV